MTRRRITCAPLSSALQSSPFKGLSRNQTKEMVPGVVLGVQGGLNGEKAAYLVERESNTLIICSRLGIRIPTWPSPRRVTRITHSIDNYWEPPVEAI